MLMVAGCDGRGSPHQTVNVKTESSDFAAISSARYAIVLSLLRVHKLSVGLVKLIPTSLHVHTRHITYRRNPRKLPSTQVPPPSSTRRPSSRPELDPNPRRPKLPWQSRITVAVRVLTELKVGEQLKIKGSKLQNAGSLVVVPVAGYSSR